MAVRSYDAPLPQAGDAAAARSVAVGALVRAMTTRCSGKDKVTSDDAGDDAGTWPSSASDPRVNARAALVTFVRHNAACGRGLGSRRAPRPGRSHRPDEGRARSPRSGPEHADARIAMGDEVRRQHGKERLGNVRPHPVVDAVAGQDHLWEVAVLLGLALHGVRLDADEVAPTNPRRKGRQLHFGPMAARTSEVGGPSRPKIIASSSINCNVQVPLGVLDRIGGFGDGDARCAMNAVGARSAGPSFAASDRTHGNSSMAA